MSICAYCKKEFINHSHSPVNTCSHSCASKLMWEKSKLPRKITKNCAECQKEIYVFPNRLKEFNYCSRKCIGNGLKRRMKKGITIFCKFCNKKFYITRARVGKAQYCSMSCATKDHFKQNPKFNKDRQYFIGEKHHNWKGGKSIHSSGYILIRTGKQKYRFEHRVVIEKILGRPLKRSEHVHHIDGDKTNNKEENLMLFANAREHANYHISISGKAHN